MVLIQPPPPPKTWRLIPDGIYSSLSRVPSVYGDTTGIFLNAYRPAENGIYIRDGTGYNPVQIPLSFDPWVTEGNIAAARFNIYGIRGDEVYISNGVLTPAYGRSAVGYISE